MWTIVGGIAAIFLGILGLINWWSLLLKALAAIIPFFLLLGGVIAVIMGISSVKEQAEEKRIEKDIAKQSEKDNKPSPDI